MRPVIKVILAGALGVILLDTVGSLSARSLGFEYHSLSVASWLLYAVVGFAAARSGGLKWGAVAGCLIGLVDATLGWAISWWIGPGRPPAGFDPLLVAFTILFVTLMASAGGLVGGVAYVLFRPRRTV